MYLDIVIHCASAQKEKPPWINGATSTRQHVISVCLLKKLMMARSLLTFKDTHTLAYGMTPARQKYLNHLHRAHLIVINSNNSASLFQKIARNASIFVGRSWSFTSALTIVLVWACLGPVFRFSDTWQLVINTGTTIVTFLMVFLIQNQQNRDTIALRLKIDELILATQKAHNLFVHIEHLNEQELAEIEKELQAAVEVGKEITEDP
jgi:low affinity Fe/Cu permease